MKDNYLNTQSSLSMKGSGYYSAKTIGAKNAIDKTQKLIENAKIDSSNLCFQKNQLFGIMKNAKIKD